MPSKSERLAQLDREEQALVASLAALRARRQEAATKLEFVQPADGAVVKWRHAFRTGGPEYSYAAVRIGENWYLTGTRGDAVQRYTWEELTNLWDFRQATNIVVATSFLPLATR